MIAGEAFTVSVQEADFDTAALQRALLAQDSREGAVVTFTGYVRSASEQRQVHTLELEHYPGMTQSSIEAILQQARSRWGIFAATVVHRIGQLHSGDQIVWVGVSSAHREDAFSACEFIMDYLKTRAPFWKKERGPQGEHWVEARRKDAGRAARWHSVNDNAGHDDDNSLGDSNGNNPGIGTEYK